MGDVRNDGVEHAQQQRKPLAGEFSGRAGRVRRRGLERVEHLHSRRHDRVVLQALIVEVGLLQLQIQLAPGGAQPGRRARPVDRGRRARQRVGSPLRVKPQALQEAVGPLDPGIRPQRRVLGLAGKHDVESRGVGAEAVDQILRLHAIALGFAHLADAAILDG